MESLAELRERRAFECRLTPDRALRSLGEADLFLRGRGMLTRTTDCALPSLYEACHEEPLKPGSPGFSTWPATKWPWFGELTERGHLCVAVHRGKNLLVTGETAALLDPICRAETDRMRAADPGWRRLLDHLATAGPSDIESLRLELGLKRQELKALRSPLERAGVIVARSMVMTSDRGDGHTHASELSRWDQACPDGGAGPEAAADPTASLADLLVAAVKAAVLAPESELRRWFSWSWYWTPALVDDLIRDARLRRLDGCVTADLPPRAPPAGDLLVAHPGDAILGERGRAGYR
jgi:hypothetical protein